MTILQVNYKSDDCSYCEDITELDETAVIKARRIVSEYIDKGILTNKSFDDDTWILDNQNQIRTLVFPVDSNPLNNICMKVFKFSARNFITLEKTYIVLNFGASSVSLQTATSEITAFSKYLTGNVALERLKTAGAKKLADFISLLPEVPDLDDVREELEFYAKSDYRGALGEQRALAQFRSYLKFGELLDNYWENATDAEMVRFFPIWFWWKVSTLIPLRPTELTLTPRRNCITEYGKLTVRRTKLKTKKFSSEYRLDLDYTKYFYKVPEEIINAVEWYFSATEESYLSNEDILFSLDAERIAPDLRLNAHFTYNDMERLLKKFYQEIIVDRQHYNIVDFSESNTSELLDNEIETINLGDTRHLAMVSIFITTQNPEMCRELAGHSDINISSHYYTNMQNFIKAISFEKVKKQNMIYTPQNQSKAMAPIHKTPLLNGDSCLSENIANGNYADCRSAVDKDGHLFVCVECQYHLSANPKTTFNSRDLSQNKVSDADFKDSFSFLLHTINRVRKGLGMEEDIQSAFLKMQASAKQYENKLVKQYAMEEFYGTTV